MRFRAVLRQALDGLSDRETESALADRLSFRRFCGLGLTEGVPDHTVHCRFRAAVVEPGAMERRFGGLDRQRDAAGVLEKRGTMPDATLVASPSARPRDGKVGPARDAEAGSARRQGKPGSVWGCKAHVGVDEASGLVRKVVVTPADVNGTVVADALLSGVACQVLADAACHTHARQAALMAAALMAAGVKPRLARPAAAETTFATWKNRMGLTAIRYVGLARATAQVTMVALAFNLRRWAALAA